MTTAKNIALLAPVPLEHLESGEKKTGRVAFGSRADKLFVKLDERRGKDAVDVYIYASHSGGPAVVSWKARYVKTVPAVSGSYPKNHPTNRPESTFTDTPDSTVFWEVDDLKPLKPPIPIGELRGLDNKKNYGHQFRPRGPLLIEDPS
jgi:hypothetical protein